MRAYSTDLRQKVLEAYLKGEGSMRQIAERFAVSLNFVWLLIERYRRTGGVEPNPHGGGQRRKLDPYQEQVLVRLVKQHPVATLSERAQPFEAATGIRLSVSTVGLTLRRHGITRKTVSYHAREREADEEVEQAREQFRQAQPQMAAGRWVFIDEAGVNLGMARRYGRAPQGQRVQAAQPVQGGPNISLIGALGQDGVRAVREVQGAVNGTIFKTFLTQCLAPHLKPGDQVWMDTLKAHKVAGGVEAIEACGATAHYLPAYSPEFSPIEPCWSKLKGWLRGAAARTREELDEALRNGLDSLTKGDFRNGFKHCGFCIEYN